MKISIITQDQELSRLCTNILGELQQVTSIACAASLGEVSADCDLYICDFDPGAMGDVAAALQGQDLQKFLFVTDRDHLSALRTCITDREVRVLFKPVTASALRASIGSRSVQRADQQSEHGQRAGDLRAARDEMLQYLIEASLRLQDHERESANLLARAVHDFRTPLTALRGYCGLLLGEQLGSLTPDQKDVLERMQRSAHRLSRMANTMFQLSIAQAARTLELKHGDIAECIEQAVNEVAPYAAEKRINISVNVVSWPEPLFFEHSQLEQVLINLLDNACKFTPCDGLIEIRGYPFFWERRVRQKRSARSADRRCAQADGPNAFRVDVHDSGPGIPAADVEKLFIEHMSYSGDSGRSGGGLGLAICKLIVHQHEGRIWAESLPTGATFSFVLPFRRATMHALGEGTVSKRSLCEESVRHADA